MKGFITIVAASAVLSASLCAGLAATDSGASRGSPQTAVAAPVPATQIPAAQTSWTDPPAKAATACRDAGWPYRTTLCAAKDGTNEAPVRKVRVIPANAAPSALALR